MAAAQALPSQPLKGYNLVANVMGQYPEFSIHRRFMAAHNYDLMLQEAEILHLMLELKDIRNEDMQSGDENVRAFDTNFRKLIESRKTIGKSLQWTKTMELRLKLKEYADHLLQAHSLHQLPVVNKKSASTFRKWLEHFRGGQGFLTSYEQHLWMAEAEDDLTSLDGRDTEHDTLSRFIKGKLLTWLHRHWLHRWKDNFVTIYDPISKASVETPLDVFSDRAIENTVAVLSTTISSLLPTMSIFVLYFVHNQLVRLGIILVLTMWFSIIVMVLTNARRSECFAATAAFSAISVVFVSGSSSVPSSM